MFAREVDVILLFQEARACPVMLACLPRDLAHTVVRDAGCARVGVGGAEDGAHRFHEAGPGEVLRRVHDTPRGGDDLPARPLHRVAVQR